MSGFLYETGFFYFFLGFFKANISVNNSLHLGTENIPTFFVFFWGNLVFRLGWPFSESVSKKIQTVFCGISAGQMAFLWKKAAINLDFQQRLHDIGARAVLKRINGGIRRITGDLRTKTANSKKIHPEKIKVSLSNLFVQLLLSHYCSMLTTILHCCSCRKLRFARCSYTTSHVEMPTTKIMRHICPYSNTDTTTENFWILSCITFHLNKTLCCYTCKVNPYKRRKRQIEVEYKSKTVPWQKQLILTKFYFDCLRG